MWGIFSAFGRDWFASVTRGLEIIQIVNWKHSNSDHARICLTYVTCIL